MITTDRLRELLHYDAETGVFTWLAPRPRARIGEVAGGSHSLGYRRIRLDGVDHYCHRLAWLYVHGVMPDGILDHIDRDKANNRIVNLRIVSPEENQQNRLAQKNNKSGFRGVSWHRGKCKWVAYIQHKGDRFCLGYFETPSAAYAMYCNAASHMHTHNPAAAKQAAFPA